MDKEIGAGTIANGIEQTTKEKDVEEVESSVKGLEKQDVKNTWNMCDRLTDHNRVF